MDGLVSFYVYISQEMIKVEFEFKIFSRGGLRFQ